MIKKRDKARRGPAISVLIVVLLVILAAMPTTATAPRPVIPWDDSPSGDAGSNSGGGDPSEGQVDCLVGSSGTVATLASYPGPVILVDPRPQKWQPVSPCKTQLSLSLEVKSPDEREPEGADAHVGGASVLRPVLEAGYETTLPAPIKDDHAQ